MADKNKKISVKGITVDAQLCTLPSDEQEITEEELYISNPNDNGSPSPHGTNNMTYNLENFPKHAMLILNHEKITDNKLPRYGSKQDVEALDKTFKKLGFEVKICNNLINEHVIDEVKTFCSLDFTDVGCVAVAVLTHGSKNSELKSSDGTCYNERDVIEFLKCSNNETLLGKPRILVIQACRAFNKDRKNTKGVIVFETENNSETLEVSPTPEAAKQEKQEEKVKHYSLSLEPNMLVVHSSYPAKISYRNDKKGSWLIQTLCNKINELAPSVDLNTILTEIKREVAIEHQYPVYNRVTCKMDKYKQMPVTTSTLTKKLYLKHSSEAVLNVPMLIQEGPCFCFLDHYNYMFNCLRFYLQDHPNDMLAMMCYEIAIEFQDGPAFHGPKGKMLKNFSICLNKTNFKYQKYMHLYN